MKKSEKIILFINLFLSYMLFISQGYLIIIVTLLISALIMLMWSSMKANWDIFIKSYLFSSIALLLNMSFISMAITVLLGYFIWEIFNVIAHRALQRTTKKEINYFIASGLSLEKAIEKSFSMLNKNRKLNIKIETIKYTSKKLAELQKKMPIENVAEIYQSFIYWFVFKGKIGKLPKNLSDQELIAKAKNLNFKEKNGFFVLKV